MPTFFPYCRLALLGAALLLPLGALPAAAQSAFAIAAPQPPLEYMTLTVIESAKQQYGEAYLEGYDSATEASNSYAYRRNQERLAKQLDELAAEGWEVLEVHPAPYLPASDAYSTRYLLRRARR